MSVCASSSVVFEARSVTSSSLPSHSLVGDDERWAMLNKSTFQEILNALLAQSQSAPPNQPPPPPSSHIGQRSFVATRKTANKSDHRTSYYSIDRINCNLASTRNSEISARVGGVCGGDEDEKDRCKEKNSNDLHSFDLTGEEISDSVQREFPVGRTNLTKIRDFDTKRGKRDHPDGVRFGTPACLPSAIENVNHAPTRRLFCEGVVYTTEDADGDKILERIGFTGVTLQNKTKVLDNENSCKKIGHIPGRVYSISDVLKSTPIPGKSSEVLFDVKAGSEEGLHENDGTCYLIPETDRRRPSPCSVTGCSVDLPPGKLSEIAGGGSSKSVEQNFVTSAAEIKILLPVQSSKLTDAVVSPGGTPTKPSGDQKTEADTNSSLSLISFHPQTLDTKIKRRITNAALRVKNLNIEFKHTHVVGPDVSDTLLTSDDSKLTASTPLSVERNHVSVAISNRPNSHDEQRKVDSRSYTLAWSRWMAMDKDMLFCIIEHVLNGEAIGFTGEICFTSPLFSIAKKTDLITKTSCDYLQLTTKLRTYMPGKSDQGTPCSGDITSDRLTDKITENINIKSFRQGSVDVPISGSKLEMVKNAGPCVNRALRMGKTVAENGKLRKKKCGLRLRKRKRNFEPACSECIDSNRLGSLQPTQCSNDTGECVTCERISHDHSHSSFKWKSEMISRLNCESKTGQNIAITEKFTS